MFVVAPVGWERCIDAYMTYHELRGLSPHTVQWRTVILNRFVQFHCEEGLQCTPSDCPPEHCQKFLWWLRRGGLKPVSVEDYYRVLRAFFNWLRQQGLRDDNPVLQVPKPKADAPLPRTVTEEHFKAVLSVLNRNDFPTLRNKALFLLAFDSGARVSELLNLRVGDVDLLQRQAIVRGKGGRDRIIVFGQTTAQALVRYLTKRALLFGELTPEAWVFVTISGGKMDRDAALRCWRRAQKKAGVKMLPFHGLRHGFARCWLLSGGDGFSLQLLLGHKSNTTTQRYVTLWATDLQKLHQERSPVDRLRLSQPRLSNKR